MAEEEFIPSADADSDISVTSAQTLEQLESLGCAYRDNAKVRIIVDSCGDFDPEVVKVLGIDVLPFTYVIDGVEYADDLWQSMSPHEFYEQMREGKQATTVAVTPGRYYEYFKQFAEEGTPAIYLGLTRGLSSSIDYAVAAASVVRQNYPGYEIYAIDTLCPSATTELLTIETVRQAAKGLSINEVVAFVEEARYHIQGYFTLESLDSLARGGRIPSALAQATSLLDVKPDLSYDLKGALTLRRIYRGRHKALRGLVADFEANYVGPEEGEEFKPIVLVSSDSTKDLSWLAAEVRKEPGCENVPMLFSSVSPVIGSHVGPGMVGVGFWAQDRREPNTVVDRVVRGVRNWKS